ncbi:hypothetical protein [Sporosarcina sp. 6E9]|uniref:hypothetical protein n=1 Tax=Sporosarcina sp. 6E9 TaxID=2819235 RepID=UPI001AC42668|nr:hypothetical protein [Sporosarcina sp. 6E9]MBO1910066.1 hypothetical protein [Microvirga sp. 3-52]
MIRSLSFTYLFVILAVGYLGGALLFREMPLVSVEKLLVLFDGRVVEGHAANFIKPVFMNAVFFLVAFGLSFVKKLRFLVTFIGALKCVLFGLSTGFLLSTGMKMLAYTVWWFPFQLAICFLLLLFCAILKPPFFIRTVGQRKRNDKALLFLLGLVLLITAIEYSVFYYILK